MGKVQIEVVLQGTHAATLANLDGHGAGNDVVAMRESWYWAHSVP